jgi:hypothetical protein
LLHQHHWRCVAPAARVRRDPVSKPCEKPDQQVKSQELPYTAEVTLIDAQTGDFIYAGIRSDKRGITRGLGRARHPHGGGLFVILNG